MAKMGSQGCGLGEEARAHPRRVLQAAVGKVWLIFCFSGLDGKPLGGF